MKTIEENNKLIAEFMEFDKNPNETFEIPQFGTIRPNGYFQTEFNDKQLKFHESWDWLMPVVSKCRSLSNDEDSYWEVIYYTLEECEIITTYQAVIQFIEFYND
jgi:hypothetical protein